MPFDPYGNWYQAGTQPAPKVGDRPKDRQCRRCLNKGKVVLASVEFDGKHWVCKLCGKEEIEA